MKGPVSEYIYFCISIWMLFLSVSLIHQIFILQIQESMFLGTAFSDATAYEFYC